MKALESNRTELPIGQSKALRFMGRLFPRMMFNLLNPAKGHGV